MVMNSHGNFLCKISNVSTGLKFMLVSRAKPLSISMLDKGTGA